MLQLENPIKYDNIILVCIGDNVLIPTKLDKRLKPYKEFQGVQYSLASVISILKDVKYLYEISPKGIYEILNNKLLVQAVYTKHTVNDSNIKLEVDINDVFILDMDKDSFIYEHRQEVFHDLKNKLYFNEETDENKDISIPSIDLLKYNLLYNTDELRGFVLGQALSLRFCNKTLPQLIFKSNIDNIELINNEVYLVFHLPSNISINQLKEFIDNDEVIGVKTEDGYFDHIKIKIDSRYIDNNLNYIITDDSDKKRYFNNIRVLEKYIINEVLHFFHLERRLGINNFKFHSINKCNINKNQFNLIYVLKSINNPQLEHRLKMLNIYCRYGEDLNIKILTDNLNKYLLNKNESLSDTIS